VLRSECSLDSSAAHWKRRARLDALIAFGIGGLVISASVVLVGVGGEHGDGSGIATAGIAGNAVALILSITAIVVLLGGSWFIVRRLRDLQAIALDNRQLSQALAEAAEAERTRLAQNLHDDLGQHLTAIGLLSECLRRRLADASPGIAADADRLAQIAEQTGHRVRALTRVSMVDWTERVGLRRSLESLCASASQLFNIRIEARIPQAFHTADPAIAPHIARIVGEAINNAVRHDNPERILVTMRMVGGLRGAGSPRAELVIEAERADEAVPAAKPRRPAASILSEPGLGMVIMRARARAIGGELTAIERDGGGIAIRCQFPWSPGEPDERDPRLRKTTGWNGTDDPLPNRPPHAGETSPHDASQPGEPASSARGFHRPEALEPSTKEQGASS
jgi:signal transduction histidine kinase